MLWLKRPGKMLWDYREPQPKVFVTDGKWAWFYVPGERQARKAAVKKLDDLRSPLRYLLGKTKLERNLRGWRWRQRFRRRRRATSCCAACPRVWRTGFPACCWK